MKESLTTAASVDRGEQARKMDNNGKNDDIKTSAVQAAAAEENPANKSKYNTITAQAETGAESQANVEETTGDTGSKSKAERNIGAAATSNKKDEKSTYDTNRGAGSKKSKQALSVSEDEAPLLIRMENYLTKAMELNELNEPHWASAIPVSGTMESKKGTEGLKSPKKPRTGYNFFQFHVREVAAKEANKDESSQNLTKAELNERKARITGKLWKRMDRNFRGYFKKLADLDKVRYKNELVHYELWQRSKEARPNFPHHYPHGTYLPHTRHQMPHAQVTPRYPEYHDEYSGFPGSGSQRIPYQRTEMDPRMRYRGGDYRYPAAVAQHSRADMAAALPSSSMYFPHTQDWPASASVPKNHPTSSSDVQASFFKRARMIDKKSGTYPRHSRAERNYTYGYPAQPKPMPEFPGSYQGAGGGSGGYEHQSSRSSYPILNQAQAQVRQVPASQVYGGAASRPTAEAFERANLDARGVVDTMVERLSSHTKNMLPGPGMSSQNTAANYYNYNNPRSRSQRSSGSGAPLASSLSPSARGGQYGEQRASRSGRQSRSQQMHLKSQPHVTGQQQQQQQLASSYMHQNPNNTNYGDPIPRAGPAVPHTGQMSMPQQNYAARRMQPAARHAPREGSGDAAGRTYRKRGAPDWTRCRRGAPSWTRDDVYNSDQTHAYMCNNVNNDCND
mmetsp:Transcript_9912/g.18063  ORF Transcript_9912/g.18063 Transcript_9912/m.18063 type:complete len:677 (+) Transcript_9912:154-2184(+)|eukprot:CAMPEP_0197531756 /NCGR_PEP_ID=MMETSP1318-20131121/36994_1 /TAXON_ID=552666 /ORGANISM="Partenskyella glossopodia, Strain RCC365" /LENGTH=676 /DNA_ID=CAMNT_0043088085 /DNA_START=3 /DNA_END=2033 /DNA_ORIENTATION=+